MSVATERAGLPCLWIGWLVFGLAYSVAYFLFDVSIQGWLLLGMNLAAGFAVLVGVGLNAPSRPAPWYLFAAGLFVYGFGNIIWFARNLILGAGESIVFVSNFFFAGGYALLGLAFVISLRRRLGPRFMSTMLDALIMVAGTTVLWWAVLIQPLAAVPNLSPVERIAGGLYPFLDIVLLALFGALVQKGPRALPQRFIVFGLGAMLAADGIYYWYALHHSFELGGVADALWLLSFIAYGAATLHPHSAEERPDEHPTANITGRRVAYFVIAALVGPVALGAAALSDEVVSLPVFVASSVGLFLLVLFRMVWLLRNVEAQIVELDERREALKASEARHRALLHSIHEVIFQVDMKGNWTFLSPAWERLTGYGAVGSLGRNFLEYVHPEDGDKIVAAMAAVMAGEVESHRAPLRYVTQNGSIAWGEVEASPLYNSEGVQVGAAGTLEDITERRLAEQALSDAEERYRTLVEQIPAVVYIDSLDPSGASVYISPRLQDLIGFTPDDWRAMPPGEWVRRLHPDDRDRVLVERERADNDAESFVLEYRFEHRDGSYLWLHDEATMVRDENGRRLYWQGLVSDVTGRKTLEERLRHQAFHDPLTELANRELLLDRIDHALSRTERTGEQVAVLFIDLDNFKNVNDSLGHAAGDELLCAVAERLKDALRTSDTAARLGGDEFAILIESTEKQGASAAAERILASLQDPFTVVESKLLINASIGIALSSAGDKAGDLLRRADTAMYEAKGRGRGRFEVFESRMESGALRRLELHSELKKAIDSDEIVLHYQPVFRLATLEVVGAEALVRWNHPSKGMVSPGDFVPIAEESGLIIPLGQAVLERACAQMTEWNESLGRVEPLRLGINFSGRQLQLPSLVETVSHTFDRYRVDPSQFIIEITESVLMHDPDDIAGRLRDLRDLGLHIAIDDFGTGFSSLSYLRRFPVEILKVDRFFVQGMDGGPAESSYAKAIVRLGHSLGLDVVGEGIETHGELDELRNAGCDFGQGFLLARPVPAEELTGLLTGEAAVPVA